MAKKVKAIVKLALNAGKATPAPPVGPALGQHGVNIMGFVKEYNARTADKVGQVIPVEITIFQDGSFNFITKTPPVADMIKKAAKVEKGSGTPNKLKIGKLSRAQVKEIAEIKMPDLNAYTIESAMAMVEGTARSMGVVVED